MSGSYRATAVARPFIRNRYLLLLDAALLPLATVLAAALRFDGLTWPAGIAVLVAAQVAISLPLKLFLLWRLGVYRRLWQYASISDLECIAAGAAAAGAAGGFVGAVLLPLLGDGRVPYSVLLLDVLLGALALVTPRLLFRVATQRRRRRSASLGRRVIVAGAGAAGDMIVRELLAHPQLSLLPVAFVDDDPSKRSRRLHGVPIIGALGELPRLVDKLGIDEVVIAMPSAPGRVIRRIVQAASEAGVPTRTVPGIYELLAGRKSVSALRSVQIEDLLRREPICTDLEAVRGLATGETVLVTGAGGSIGGELCRQLASLNPARIIALGRGENSIFELLQELTRSHPSVQVVPVIADVRDASRISHVFETYRPFSVFHAAAHKHVPLMEENVAEAVLNNVLGTRTMAEQADCYGAEHFVLISSDKAVRPSSIMGATKRIAEGIVQQYARRSKRSFVAVRFGNVLGSRGSVIPTFLRQIQAGGPLTITHPEMCRYFMTIPEAVQLVLQAGAMGQGEEVFVLDMGEPVRVLDLARDLIRLSGLEEGHDVEIRFTGMRPGEKLYEELFFDEESAVRTEHEKVLRARNAALALDGPVTVDELIGLAQRHASPLELRSAIKLLVPEYTGVTDEDAARVLAADSDGRRRVASGAAPRLVRVR